MHSNKNKFYIFSLFVSFHRRTPIDSQTKTFELFWKSEQPITWNLSHFCPSRRRLAALNGPSGEHSGRSRAWLERRATDRTLSRARRAQVQLAATRIALHTHKLWRRRRTRSSSPDMKRGAPCGGTAFVALWCCARGADGAVEATVDVAYTCSLRETAHCARPPSAPSGIRRSRESPPTHSLL